MNILLIEPNYKNKYPPLGLMKISTYHKEKGDNVIFYKGCLNSLKEKQWDRIYIASLFTFHWAVTRNTIKYYLNSVRSPKNIFIGGVLATLFKKEISEEFDINVVDGLLNKKGKLGFNDDQIIDCLLPDYSIIDLNSNDLLTYKYPVDNSYIAYATRGCIRKCKFCAVPIIEGEFSNSLSIKKQFEEINKTYGEKKNLLLLDNNILAAGEHFFNIIQEIKEIGFYKDAKFIEYRNGRKIVSKRYVDFNQGIDARLLVKDEKYIQAISEIAIKPLRIAFDNIQEEEIYKKSARLAAKYGIKTLSNYILFNYKDSPQDFYRRLEINVELNEEFERNGLQSRIWSFPMKYSPINGKHSIDRKYLGKHWTKKELRGIQCILLATHGVVGPKIKFFYRAFGKSYDEFKQILLLPEDLIIYRDRFEKNGFRKKFESKFNNLSQYEIDILKKYIFENDFKNIEEVRPNKKVFNILNDYKYYKSSES